VIVVPLAALVALEAWQAFGRAPELVRSRELVTHASQVIESAQRLRSALQDAERGQRGYLITGAPAYLEAYHNGSAKSAPRLQQLRELTADNPEQQARIARLSNRIIHHGRLDPAVALITKPFTQASLAAKVRAVLEG
jgi:CHASE3 domain sensor protein